MKLFILSKILSSFIQITEPDALEHLADTLQEGESAWVTGKLSNSYENEIFAWVGMPTKGRSMEEYRAAFETLGLELEHLEIKRDMVLFAGIEELRDWIRLQVRAELLIEQCLSAIEQKGWIDLGNSQIGLPISQLIACVIRRYAP